jgi:hypothetical protein
MVYYDQIDRGLICAHFLYLPFTIICSIDLLNQAVEGKAYHISLSTDVLYQAVAGKAYHISLYFVIKFQRNG